ncbi:hypothetical protein [Streptomyces sp. NPDC058247]|uniref:hypothetical protein n=1 Tax=Streptomyces sp. NPDC058247 TaxID=3346401 RepID=UPI0036E7F557
MPREAWHFTRDAWSAGRPVTVKALADHPAFEKACEVHAERLAAYLPSRRTRHDNSHQPKGYFLNA